MRAATTTRLVVAAFAALCVADPAAAQTQVFGLNVEGDIEAGFRGFAEQPSSQRRAKFEEYRDFPAERPFLSELRLRFFRPDESYSSEFSGSKWGQQDQEFSLRTGRLGLWEFGFDWDQTPYIFSTNARMLATETSRGVFTLPAARPGVAAGTSFEDYNSARRRDEISVRWDTARIFFRLTPTPDLELKATYTRTNKDGDRPMGVPFRFNFIEVLEPIEQTIHDVRLQGTIAREQWQLQFGYTLSMFQNSLSALTADSPFRSTFEAFGASAANTSNPASGRVSLPPDNVAHTFNLAGGANLPWWRTRVTSNFSYSLRLQNDDFLPHTLNPNIVAAGGPDLVLPQKSLNGNVQIFLFNLNATSRPLPPLTLSLKYRLYDYEDRSDQITFPAIVESDAVLEEARRAGRWSYRKQNTDIDGRWQIVQPVAFTLGAGWERWDRNEHREVPESDEFFGKAVLDVTPSDWLLVRAKYIPSFRRINRYNTRAHALHETAEEDATSTQGQSFLLRKFDEAERDRHRVDLLVQFMPTDTFTVTPTVGYRFDNYLRSAGSSTLGLREETNWSAGMDFNWTPAERVSLFAGYIYELIFQKQRSRNRPVVGADALDFADFDWISDNTDTVHTVRVGFTATLIPRVLDWTTSLDFSTATGRIETRNPVGPRSGSAAQNATAQAKPMPAFEDNLYRLESALKYYFWKNWTAKLGYVFDAFDKHDWRTDTLNPFIPGVATAAGGGIFLGNDLKNYTAHIVALSLAYRFK